MAFFCSNRHGNSGCGRTVSVTAAEVISRCSVLTSELYCLINLLMVTSSVAEAWRLARKRDSFSLSLASAYRWRNTFVSRIHHYRSRLMMQLTHPPPEEDWIASPNSAIALTIEMFDEATPGRTLDPFSAFQIHHQHPIHQ